MNTPTNAQTALLATATLYSGASGYSNWKTLTATADAFKDWLDQHDTKDQERKRIEAEKVGTTAMCKPCAIAYLADPWNPETPIRQAHPGEECQNASHPKTIPNTLGKP